MHRLKAQPKNRPNLEKELAEVARTGALFIDGDCVRDVFVPGAETWTSGDDINFRHGPFIEVKRTVLRIERIPPYRVFALVAVVRKDDPAKCEAVVCGLNNAFGQRPVPMSGAMKRCVAKGVITTERTPRKDFRAFAPIKNSEGEPAGFLMVFTALGA